MKKTSFFDGPAFVSRTIRGLASAAIAATALLSALPLTTRADDAPGASVPATKPTAQTIPRQTATTKPGAATQKGESAAAKVNGQISVILEGWIDGEDAFVFRDNKISIQHKSFKIPYEITVNGKPWEDLSKPFELGFTPDPAKTQFACEGRGQKSMSRTDDSVTVSIYDQDGAATRYRIILFQPSGVKNPLAMPKKPIEKTVMEIPTGSTLATAAQANESAAAKVNGQISVILEGWIDGEDAFVFRDGRISVQHKSFKIPYEITVNGKPWKDLSKPFELGFTPDPAKTQFACEGRGQKSMSRTDDSVTVSIYDQDGAATRYRIILFQPSGVKNPLAMPKKPIEKTVMEIPTGSTLATAAQAAKPRQTADPEEEPTKQDVMVLEGTFDGRGVFLFLDNMIGYSHKSGKYPADVKVNGKPWTDLKQPFTMDAASIPAKIIRKQARGTVTLLPNEDFSRLEIDDHQDASAHYRIEFDTK